MSPFRLRKDARAWFRGLESSMDSGATLFEFYYFCVAIGLTYLKKADVTNDESDELVNYFPGEFKVRGRLLTGWLIATELENMGISLTERTQVHQLISTLVDPQSPSFLNDTGVKAMNRYASGGFEILTENVSEPPRDLTAFLRQFRRLVSPTP